MMFATLSVRPKPTISLNLLIDMPFFAGILILGLPYLAWMAWRRTDKLIGDETPSTRNGKAA
jgi:threonine/homoserine/homoserine lactone efflux protein